MPKPKNRADPRSGPDAGLKARALQNGASGSIPPAFNTLPTIHSMGPTIFDPIYAQRRHPSNGNELVYVVKGQVNIHVHGAILKAAPGDMVLIPCNTLHLDAFDLAEGLETYMVYFRWEAESDYFHRVPIRRFHDYCSRHHADIEPFIERLRLAHSRHAPESIWLAQTYLLTLLSLVFQGVVERRDKTPASEDYGHRRRHTLFKKARTWIDTHYREPITLEAIAQTLSISPYYLSHIFSQDSEFTLFAYLTNLRMQKAKLLLQQGSHNVSEAAYAVGFNDPNYFSRAFRRFFGFAPREIRT